MNIKSHLSSFCVRMSPCQTFCCLLDFFVWLLLVSILDPSVLLYGVNIEDREFSKGQLRTQFIA